MRHRHTPALLALLAPLGALHCSDSGRGDTTLLDELVRVGSPVAQQPLAPVPDHCRTVAAQRSVSVDGSSGQSSCQFDEATSQLSCRTALGASGELVTSDFASRADFVEAGHVLGKITSLRELRQKVGSELSTRYEYDELGRLIQSRERRADGELVFTYSDFDDAGRPREALPSRATRDAWGCDVAPLSIEYGDAAGTVRYSYRPPAYCGVPDYSILEHYDALGNRVQVERSSAAGSETTFEAGTPLAMQTVCD